MCLGSSRTPPDRRASRQTLPRCFSPCSLFYTLWLPIRSMMKMEVAVAVVVIGEDLYERPTDVAPLTTRCLLLVGSTSSANVSESLSTNWILQTNHLPHATTAPPSSSPSACRCRCCCFLPPPSLSSSSILRVVFHLFALLPAPLPPILHSLSLFLPFSVVSGCR